MSNDPAQERRKMENQVETISLARLGHGAAQEKFETEFHRVLENILDPNTKATQIREISLKVKIKPNDGRDLCSVSIECVSKLAAEKPFETQFFVGNNMGQLVATEYDPQQMRLGINFPSDRLAEAVAKGGGE